MTCGGCSGAVNRVLGKNIQAPNAYHISLPSQTVLIWGPSLPPFDEITAKIAKTGKAINSQEVVEDATKLPSIEA
ncbi:copper chaperone [Kwoniella mangroviensis CBS 10435]|uniref:Copper chaperone n=1 Tax=Kwoniella mangroviensis CBS 10435 TaxID=1331196 RepID=A0A1B9J1V0_9TREE|nr:copper chaperone [Kwoniella mangroviensis CBS 8507]OCF61760.1 copper chaperone [Kwoniella mangroviensis CBS 10435]OCF67228.1 copper chaperone [Kwoniella mangroviensis CBS 8507]OCF77778.1 copper chaperone [Kwoniella mangroviensis CBS 8886]